MRSILLFNTESLFVSGSLKEVSPSWDFSWWPPGVLHTCNILNQSTKVCFKLTLNTESLVYSYVYITRNMVFQWICSYLDHWVRCLDSHEITEERKSWMTRHSSHSGLLFYSVFITVIIRTPEKHLYYWYAVVKQIYFWYGNIPVNVQPHPSSAKNSM